MPHRIMIVEDEAILALDLSWLLVDAGYEVAGIARTMHATLRLAAEGSVDLATMDIRLAGGTNGVETALKLWQIMRSGACLSAHHLTRKRSVRRSRHNQ
jgi:DNA-binding NarL/FixJ family response regulator